MKKDKPKNSVGQNMNESFRMKTEKAIELINKHEGQKYNLLKTLKQNKDYMKLSPSKENQAYPSFIEIKQICLHQNHKIQLLPFDDLIYKMLNPFYTDKQTQYKHEKQDFQPNSVKFQDKIPITQNKTLSIVNKSLTDKQLTDRKIKVLIKNYRGSATQLFFYFQCIEIGKIFNIPFKRYTLTSQKIIHINLDDFTNKKWIYIRFKTQDQLTFFSVRVENQHSFKKRFVTDFSEPYQQQKNISKSVKKLPQLKTNASLRTFKSTSLQKQPSKFSTKPRSQSLKAFNLIQLTQSSQSPSAKIKNKEILQKLKKQQMIKKKQQQDKKLSQVIAKKNAVEQARQIQLKLKSKALQMKRLVQQYKVIHQEERRKIKFLQPKIAAMLFLPQFNKICHEMILQRQKGLQIAWKIRALTKKFVKIMKRQYKEGIMAVKSKKTRELLKIRDFTTLFGKVLYKNSINKSFDVAVSTIQKFKTGLIVNQVFEYATQYRRSIRFIQKTWLNQYNAKMQIFQMYIKDQVQILIKKYPYFKYVHSKFLSQNVTHQLAYKYIAQQSSKINDLFEEYRQKLKQIDQFKQMNKKIAQFNKSALKKRQKPYLQVPKKPCYPSTRYFRNITFLKSMIRGWFELQYRKWSKVNKLSIDSISGSNKKSISPQNLSAKPQQTMSNQVQQAKVNPEAKKCTNLSKKQNPAKNLQSLKSTYN